MENKQSDYVFNKDEKIILRLTNKDQARIGAAAGCTICMITGLSIIFADVTLKLKDKYNNWKLKRIYKKAMENPDIDEEVKEALKSKLGSYIETL
jgi:hypothetical protein